MLVKLLKCGCRSNAKDDNNKDCCVIHMITDEWIEVDLTGRVAKCIYCGKNASSSDSLPFFSYKGSNQTYDSFFDGCKGWN
jgi:hypothetical protein